MDLMILDASFAPLGVVDAFISLQWTRRYYEVGSFELHTDMAWYDLLRQGRYVYRNDAVEVGVIEGLSYEQGETEEQLTVSGRFLECLLERRVIPQRMELAGTAEQICRTLVDEMAIHPQEPARAIPKLALGAEKGLGTETTCQCGGETLLEKLQELCQSQELSFALRYDYENDEMLFEVWQGKDRTQGQKENGWAVFSRGQENLLTSDYSVDEQDYRNFAYVVGEAEQGQTPVCVTVDRTNGRDRRELYVDASSVKREVDGETMTDEAYRQALWQKGLEALDGYRRVEAYNHAIDPNANLMYKTHYDLGDICTVIQEKIGLVAEKRIEEVREAVEADGLAVEMTFGEDYVSLGKAIKREVKA